MARGSNVAEKSLAHSDDLHCLQVLTTAPYDKHHPIPAWIPESVRHLTPASAGGISEDPTSAGLSYYGVSRVRKGTAKRLTVHFVTRTAMRWGPHNDSDDGREKGSLAMTPHARVARRPLPVLEELAYFTI